MRYQGVSYGEKTISKTKVKTEQRRNEKKDEKAYFFLSVGVLLFLLFLFSLEMMTAYKRQLENERYKASLDAQIYSEILIKDLMVSQNASDTLDYIARDHEGLSIILILPHPI